MKFKKIMLVTLMLLAILTIGAVGASEIGDSDSLAADETDNDDVSSPVSDDLIAGDDDDDDDYDLDDGLDDEIEVGDKDPGMVVTVPENMTAGESYQVVVNFTGAVDDEIEGEVTLYVDDIPGFSSDVYGEEVWDGDVLVATYYLCQVSLNPDSMGNHTLLVKYSGDSNYMNVSQSFDFCIENYKIYADDAVGDYGKPVDVNFVAPVGVTVPITVTVNGKEYTVTYNDDEEGYVLTLENLSYDRTFFTFTYPDANNVEQTGEGEIYMWIDINCPSEFTETSVVSAKFPDDANGTLALLIKVGEKFDDEYEEYIPVWESIANATVSGGYAEIPMYNLGLEMGEYLFRAIYLDDGKYDAHQDFELSVVPNIDIPTVIIAGEDTYINVYVPYAINGTLNIYVYVEEDDEDEYDDDDDYDDYDD